MFIFLELSQAQTVWPFAKGVACHLWCSIRYSLTGYQGIFKAWLCLMWLETSLVCLGQQSKDPGVGGRGSYCKSIMLFMYLRY